MTDRELQTWDSIVEYGIATDDELGLATALCSRSMQTLNNVISIRTGYNDLEQYENCELFDDFDDVDEEGYNPYLGSYDFDC